jgi:diacylglycerol kinase (ATP)
MTGLPDDHPSTAANHAPNFSVKARLASFVFASRGLRHLLRNEHNAWLHLAASVGVIVAGLLLRITPSDWRWLVAAMALVWVTETLNTALEELCDRISPGFDHRIGRVKDLGAGGVLVAAIAATLIGLLTLLPPLLERLACWL